MSTRSRPINDPHDLIENIGTFRRHMRKYLPRIARIIFQHGGRFTYLEPIVGALLHVPAGFRARRLENEGAQLASQATSLNTNKMPRKYCVRQEPPRSNPYPYQNEE